MFDERACLRIKSYIGILFAQERTGTLVHTEQYYGIILSQNVVLHNFVFPLRVVMIKKCFRLFVFKELQWHEGKAFVRHEYIYPAIRVFKPFYFTESLFKIGCEGE